MSSYIKEAFLRKWKQQEDCRQRSPLQNFTYTIHLFRMDITTSFVLHVSVWQSDFAAAGIELLCRLARGEMAPRLSLVSPKVFSPVTNGVWFLAAVASGLLSWGHLISSNIVDLIEQKPFELNWAGRCHHWIQ